jgi:hypothetical protein
MSRKKFIIIFNTWAIFRVQRLTDLQVQGSEVQRFKGSGFRGSQVQGFRGSQVQGLKVQGSEVQRFIFATGRWALVSGLW